MAFSSTLNSSEPSLGGLPDIQLRTITGRGRSIFATRDIEPGTRIHSSAAPFAHVIYKDYRKEVCAYCFAYSASDDAPPNVGSSRTWSIKRSREGAATAWFCSDRCRDDWGRDEPSLLSVEVDALLTKGQAATRKRFKSLGDEAKVKSMLPFLDPGGGAISEGTIDVAWETAQALAASKALALYCSTLHLEDMELEIARLLAVAIIRRYYNDLSTSDQVSQTALNPNGESWPELLNLQANELCNMQTRPHLLSSYLRIYVFLSNTLPEHLRKYMSTVREVLARDTGNTFGIWDGDRRDEMMGWGVWISASYFNHSCTPNVRKKREGKALHFEVARFVQAGEELCISYIDTDSPVGQRRRDLEESWFFTCQCARCVAESRE